MLVLFDALMMLMPFDSCWYFADADADADACKQHSRCGSPSFWSALSSPIRSSPHPTRSFLSTTSTFRLWSIPKGRHHQCQHNLFLKNTVKVNVKGKGEFKHKVKVKTRTPSWPSLPFIPNVNITYSQRKTSQLKQEHKVSFWCLLPSLLQEPDLTVKRFPDDLLVIFEKTLLRTPCFLGSSFLMIPWFLGCPWKPFRGHPVSLFSQNS